MKNVIIAFVAGILVCAFIVMNILMSLRITRLEQITNQMANYINNTIAQGQSLQTLPSKQTTVVTKK